jgi:cyanophycinase
MAGLVILAGGHEVRPGCEPMDRRVVAAAGGRDARVVFLPTAVAAYNPHGSILGAVAYFASLGVEARGVPVLTREDAERPQYEAAVREATLVYLGGGDPAHLLATLRDTAVWRAVLEVYERGGVVGGSSAGAMVVCEWVALPPDWTAKRDGLALVGNAMVMPHYRPARLGQLQERARALPDGVAILGIPEQSGLLGNSAGWEALGPEPVVAVASGTARTIAPGESIAPIPFAVNDLHPGPRAAGRSCRGAP